MNSQETTTAPFPSQAKSCAVRPIASIAQPKHALPDDLQAYDGVRSDRTWPRPNKWRRSNRELVAALEHMYLRRGRCMTVNDAGLLGELDKRAWTLPVCEGVHVHALPSWMTDFVPKRRDAGYSRFVAYVIAAYRAGAVGLWLSYSEAMALCQVSSPDTWRRWTKEMDELGLLRIVQTWTDDPAEKYARVYGRLWYRLGPELEVFAAALCEGANESQLGRRATLSRLEAHAQREAKRERDMERLAELHVRRGPYNDPRRCRRTRLAKVSVAEQERAAASLAQAKAEVTRSCNGDYIHAGAVSSPRTPCVKGMHYDNRNAPPRSEENSKPPEPEQKVSTAQARSTQRCRVAPQATRRPPPGRVMRHLAMEHAMRGMKSALRSDKATPKPPPCDNQPNSHAACGAEREFRFPFGGDTWRELAQFYVRNGYSAKDLSSAVGIPIEDARSCIREYAALSAIVDNDPTAVRQATPQDRAKLVLDDILSRELDKRARRKD